MRFTAMEAMAIASAKELVAGGRFAKLPVDIAGLAAQLGVRDISARDMASDGYLGRDRSGEFVIRYRAINNPRRNRFTIAHELGHLLLLQLTGDRGDSPPRGLDRDREERVVNRIASELLMPEASVANELASCSAAGRAPGWGSIARMSLRFDVSLAAMAIRILELPQILSASLRIAIEGPAPAKAFTSSQDPNVRLVDGAEFEIDRVWRESRRSKQHVLTIGTDRDRMDICCEGRIHTLGRGPR